MLIMNILLLFYQIQITLKSARERGELIGNGEIRGKKLLLKERMGAHFH
jgi:hypothetical protein